MNKRCKLCKKEIEDKDYEFCPWCGGDWKGGVVRDRCAWDRKKVIPKLEGARDKAYVQDAMDYWYIDGVIEGINWSFDYPPTLSVVNILKKKYGVDMNE